MVELKQFQPQDRPTLENVFAGIIKKYDNQIDYINQQKSETDEFIRNFSIDAIDIVQLVEQKLAKKLEQFDENYRQKYKDHPFFKDGIQHLKD